jgi:RNA polymerase sigma-70 factor (ECF subfamily)
MSTYNKNYLLLVDYIKNNQNKFYRLAYSYAKNKETALDIVQDSIYKALSSLDTLKDISYIKTWMYRIIVNSSLGYIRKNKRIILSENINEKVQYNNLGIEDNIDLFNAIDLLEDEQKTLITLRYFEDMKFDDISKIVDSNINTVKARTYSAISKLRNILEG